MISPLPPKHSPGPLRIEPEFGFYAIRTANGELVAKAEGQNQEVDLANAQRFLACWTACATLPDPSVVPEMLEALKNLEWGRLTPAEADRIAALITKAEGK